MQLKPAHDYPTPPVYIVSLTWFTFVMADASCDRFNVCAQQLWRNRGKMWDKSISHSPWRHNEGSTVTSFISSLLYVNTLISCFSKSYGRKIIHHGILMLDSIILQSKAVWDSVLQCEIAVWGKLISHSLWSHNNLIVTSYIPCRIAASWLTAKFIQSECTIYSRCL